MVTEGFFQDYRVGDWGQAWTRGNSPLLQYHLYHLCTRYRCRSRFAQAIQGIFFVSLADILSLRNASQMLHRFLKIKSQSWHVRAQIDGWHTRVTVVLSPGKAHPWQSHPLLPLGQRTSSSQQAMAAFTQRILKYFGLEGTLKVTFHQCRLLREEQSSGVCPKHSSRCYLWRAVQQLHLLTQGKVSLCWCLWLKPSGKASLCCLKGDEAVQVAAGCLPFQSVHNFPFGD